MCFTLLLSGKKTFEYLWLDFYRMLFFSSLEVAKQSFLWLWLRLVESQVINRILLILHILKSTVFLLSKEKKKSCMFKRGNAGDNDASDIRLLFVFAVVAFFFFFTLIMIWKFPCWIQDWFDRKGHKLLSASVLITT